MNIPKKYTLTAQSGVSKKVATVYVTQIDLQYNELAEETGPIPNEENPGGFICVNDNDNAGGLTAGAGNGTIDINDPRTPTTPLPFNDGDLKEIFLTITPNPGIGTVTFEPGNLKVWTDKQKTDIAPETWDLAMTSLPSPLYLEGISPGENDVILRYEDTPQLCQDKVKILPQKVEIVNKPDILYFYPNEVYTTGATTGSPTPVIANITPSTQTISWLIENDQSGGTSIQQQGPVNTVGVVTPVFSGNGFFKIVAKHISTECRDEQKSLIIDVTEVLASETEEAYLAAQQALGVNTIALILLANHAINFAATQSHSNAVRHVYWQALVTMDHRFGFNIAFGQSNAHEKNALVLNSGIDNELDPYDTSADLHNNVIGRQLGQGFQAPNSEYTDPIQSTIQQAVLSAVVNGIDPTITLDPEVPSNVVRLK